MKTPEQMQKQEEIKIRRYKKITQKLLRVFELFFYTFAQENKCKICNAYSGRVNEYYPQ